VLLQKFQAKPVILICKWCLLHFPISQFQDTFGFYFVTVPFLPLWRWAAAERGRKCRPQFSQKFCAYLHSISCSLYEQFACYWVFAHKVSL